jgi:hypothetical protein
MSDLVTFARDIATDTQAYINRYVAKALGPVSDRLASLEQRVELVSRAPGPPGEPGPAGRDADLNLIAELKAEVAMLKAAIEARPWPDSATMSKTLGELVTAEVARMPVPRDGRDVDVAMLQAFLEALRSRRLRNCRCRSRAAMGSTASLAPMGLLAAMA